MSIAPTTPPAEFDTRLETLMEEKRSALDQVNSEFREMEMLTRQNQSDVDRMAQRETALAGRVREMEANIDNYSRADIKATYGTFQDTQLRHIVLRKELESAQRRMTMLKERQQELFELTQLLAKRPRLSADTAITATAFINPQETISRVIQAQESERLRISLQLHDGPAQAMSNLVLRAEICEKWIDNDPSRARAELTGLKSMVNDTLQDTRRFIFELRPMILDDLGLLPTLKRYLKDYSEQQKIEINYLPSGRERRLPNHVEVAIFRIIQDALSNVARHANAAHVRIALDYSEGSIGLSVEDDGMGFDPSKVRSDNQKTIGIASMRQRIDMLGGQLNIESQAGRGTRIVAAIPLT